MSRLRVAIDISATPEQVWEVVEPIEDHIEWMHDAVAIRFRTDQHRGRRTRFSWEESLTFPWYLGGPVGALVGGRVVLRTIWNRNLANLKEIVERRVSGAG